MEQRVHPRGCDLRVLGEIVSRVEGRSRAPPLISAAYDVMVERVQACLSHVGVGREVPGGIEERIRVARFPGARRGVMDDRVDPGGGDVGIGLEIVVGVDEAASSENARYVRPRCGRSARLTSPPRRLEHTDSTPTQPTPVLPRLAVR